MNKDSLRFLVVDDDIDIAEILKTHLEWRGFNNVDITKSSKDALILVSKNKYHIVLSDVKMPEMSGAELLKKIKAVSPDSIVVMITGLSNLADVVHCQTYGALDFAFKPFGNFSEIDEVVDRAIEVLKRWASIISKVKGTDIF
ncbi:MAG: hypothetical protein A4S09_09870 [Proteobacteria bacterium SG_bin7]|nr:MAG: hypothetical protein A4S09_09870 [Proteobacteria bacterium SG_bin7]